MAKIKLRRDTAVNWASSDPVLALGEPGYDTTNNKLKIGNGTSTWSVLTFLTDVQGADGTYTPTTPTDWLGSPTVGTVVAGLDELASRVIAVEGAAGDRIVNGLNELVLDATGSLVYPNGALQRDISRVTCQGNVSTVVYTSTAPTQHTIKLLIQVEGVEGLGSAADTQACEMIVAKSFNNNDIAASVYGVVHTSVAPLATFTANWNALTSRVEVLCTTPSANLVDVKIFATEITTSD